MQNDIMIHKETFQIVQKTPNLYQIFFNFDAKTPIEATIYY